MEEEGYWVRKFEKVDISKEDKKGVGLPTMPRPDIDLVALDVRENELLLIEVKSLLDSCGVYFEAVSDEKDEPAVRYRLLTNSKFREVVTKRLCEAYLDEGFTNENTAIDYGLAAGHIHSGNESQIAEYFSKKGWYLFTPEQIRVKVEQLSRKGWEDDPVTITTK